MSATLPFDVFHRLIRQALGEARADEALELQVFTAADVPGAAVLKFFPEELAESLHAVYVPAGFDEDGSLIERLHAAVATHDGLVPVDDPGRQRVMLSEMRALLERYLAATGGMDEGSADDPADAADDYSADESDESDESDEGDEQADDESSRTADGRAPARIEFGPLEALEALAAAQRGGGVPGASRPAELADGAAEPGAAGAGVSLPRGAGSPFAVDPDPTQVAAGAAAATVEEAAFADERISFRALALDVLSGVPQPHGSAPDLADSYEVWAFRHDPHATIVLRLFDAGRAAVLGALAADDDSLDAARFFAAAYRLLATRLPDTVEGGLEGRLADLEPLGVATAMERLGRALGLEHARDVRELTTNLLGEASAETLAAYEEIRLLDPRAEESAASRFAGIAGEVVEVGGEALWTHRKERAGAPRIEVLEHREHGGALLLIDFGEAADPVEVAGYVPGESATAGAFADAARQLLEEREIFASPRPLREGGAFRRVPNSRAVHAVETALDALDGGDGSAISFRDPRTR